jgi:hypothetical protein
MVGAGFAALRALGLDDGRIALPRRLCGMPVAASQEEQAGQENERGEQFTKHGDIEKSNLSPL